MLLAHYIKVTSTGDDTATTLPIVQKGDVQRRGLKVQMGQIISPLPLAKVAAMAKRSDQYHCVGRVTNKILNVTGTNTQILDHNAIAHKAVTEY